MKTMSVKELQRNLNKVLDLVRSGEQVVIHQHFKSPVFLSALSRSSHKKSVKLAGLRAFDAAPKLKSVFDTEKPIKELYDRSIARKYGR